MAKTHPLFIPDGYTVTAKIEPDTEKGEADGVFSPVLVTYRPIAGAERLSVISDIQALAAKKDNAGILSLSREIVAEQCLEIDGTKKPTVDQLRQLNSVLLMAIRDNILLLRVDAIQKDTEAAKN